MPRISVVIPAYNYGRYLREAIASVQAQEGGHDLEMIVVDNASTDDTAAVLASIDEPRMRVLTLTPNRGFSGAANAALDEARGEFVTFLDADDRWRPHKLSHQLEVLESEPDLGAVFSDFVRFDDGQDTFYPQTQFAFFPDLESVPAVPTRAGGGWRLTDPFCSLIGFFDFPAWLQSMVFRRAAIGDIRLVPGMRLCQDMEFCMRVFRRGGVAFTREAVVEVRCHGQNLTRSYEAMTHAKVQALQSLQSEPLTPAERAALRRRIGRALVDSGRISLRTRHPLEAGAAFARALSYDGTRRKALLQLAALPLKAALLYAPIA